MVYVIVSRKEPSMFKEKTTQDFEKGKLLYQGSRPFVNSDEGTIHEYRYHGSLRFYSSVKEEAYTPFPELVFEEGDDNPNLFSGLTIREIFEQNKGENKFLLKNYPMSMPHGFYFCDPCYLQNDGDEPRNVTEKLFPAGDWEVTIKGNLSPSSYVRDVMSYLDDDKKVMELVTGFVNQSYHARGTSCWVVKPGAEFVSISKHSVHELDVDSGLAGVFPADKHNAYTWDEFLKELKSIEESPEYAANVSIYGVYSGTTYGDGGYSVYELLDTKNEVVGFVCSYNGAINEDVLGSGRTTEEVKAVQNENNEYAVEESKFNKLEVLVKDLYSNRIQFKKRFQYGDYPAIAYGTYKGYKSPQEVVFEQELKREDEAQNRAQKLQKRQEKAESKNKIIQEKKASSELAERVNGIFSGKLMDIKDAPQESTYHSNIRRSVVQSSNHIRNDSGVDLLFYFYQLPNMHYVLRVGRLDHEYRKQTEQMYIDQNITKNGKHYIPEWDDNYPDYKLLEAISEDPIYHTTPAPAVFLSLMSNLEDVPEEKALYM